MRGLLEEVISDQDQASKGISTEEMNRAFENRIWETVREGEKKCGGYHASIFTGMVAELGALGAVKKLLHMPLPSEGFTILVMCNHPELTSEAAACDRRWSRLFTKEEISTAKKWLKKVGYSP